MSTKRKSRTESSPKRQRKAIDLDMKMKIVNDHESGVKVNDIARGLKLAPSTISTILKDREKVKEASKALKGCNAVITRQRKVLIHEMEKLLAIWYEEQIQRSAPLSYFIIQTKARNIFETLKARDGEEFNEKFTASSGWFQRFRRRFNLQNWFDETANTEATEKFVYEFDVKEIICNDEEEEEKELEEKIEEEKIEEERIEKQEIIEKDEEDKIEEIERITEKRIEEKKFTVTGLDSVFCKVNEVLLELESMDSNTERFSKVQKQMNELLDCYREIYEQEKKNAKQTIQVSRISTPTSTSSSPIPEPT